MITETKLLERKELHLLSDSVQRYAEILIKTSGWERNKKGFWTTTITIKAQ
jgi:hypothetical protein